MNTYFQAYKHMLGVLVGARVWMWRSNGEELANHWFTTALRYSKASGFLSLSFCLSCLVISGDIYFKTLVL